MRSILGCHTNRGYATRLRLKPGEARRPEREARGVRGGKRTRLSRSSLTGGLRQRKARGICVWSSDRDSEGDPNSDPEMERRPRRSKDPRHRGTNGFQPLEGRGPSRPRVSLCPDPVGGFPQRCEETKNFCGGSLCFKGSGFSGVQHSPLIAQRSVPVGSGWVEPDPSSLTPLEGRLPRRPDRR